MRRGVHPAEGIRMVLENRQGPDLPEQRLLHVLLPADGRSPVPRRTGPGVLGRRVPRPARPETAARVDGGDGSNVLAHGRSAVDRDIRAAVRHEVTMTTTKARAITYVWILVSAITIVSWFLGPARTHGPVAASVPITVA